jgi:Protein of unknown function (DUF3987)/Primase C terminal 2 (PriCT-2)
MTFQPNINDHDDIAWGLNGRGADARIVPGDEPNPLSALVPNREALAAFSAAVFKNADPKGFVSLRGFKDNGKRDEPPVIIEPITIGNPAYLDIVFERARQAAIWSEPVVFCPPVTTFLSGKDAKVDNIQEGVTISVDFDASPVEGRSRLESILGKPTIVVASGGEWPNPKTGEIERKCHAHWRIKVPTKTTAEHLLLREARELAIDLVGADPSSKPLVHPLRWPGSWHRKGQPKLAGIIESNDTEIDLREALAALREISGSCKGKDFNVGVIRAAFHKPLASNPEHVALAVREIPNTDVSRAEWNQMGMAIWGATGGSDIGLKAFEEWSAKAPNKCHGPAAAQARWKHYKTSPPDRIGYGTLVYLARQNKPGWTAEPSVESCPDPVDLWAKFDPPTLPRGVLPDVIGRFAYDQGTAMGADMAGIAMSALAVCAAAIPDNIQLQVKRHNSGWLESARLWVALVGEPSSMKSPIMAAAVRPLRRIDSDMARQNSAERARYDQLTKEEKAKTEPPKQLRLLLQDTTIEAAQEILKDSPDGVLCYQDEMSGWFGSMDKYSGNRGAAKDRAFWLEAFNGGNYSVNRIGRGSVFIENLSASLIGGIQPEPIRKLAHDSMDDGLLQRLLPVILKPAVEGRDEKASEVISEFSELIGRLHNINNRLFGARDFAGALRFDDAAQDYRQELERKHLDLQQCEAINRKLAAHIGKYNGMFARLCVVWHCVENSLGRLPPVITEATARRAGAFLHGFLLPHALAFYAGVLGLSNDHDRLTAVAGYILAHKLERITNRDVQRGDQTMRGLDKREIEAIFDQLDALGWIDRIPGPRPTAPSHWRVNPVVHARFAERARSEAERRLRDREMIVGMLQGGRK